ncbi:hypothetical protein ACFE04_000850 [Oxalis oulophora]
MDDKHIIKSEEDLSKIPRHKRPPDYSALEELVKPHIESFDYMIDKGLDEMVQRIAPPEVQMPMKESGGKGMHAILLPYECRQAKISYTGKFTAELCFQYNGGQTVIRERVTLGQFPIMLKSKLCHLRGASPKKLASHKEETSEVGGYFICNGLERVARLLILQKQNHPMSMVRNSFCDRRQGYTDKAVVIRCVRPDQSSVSLKLYYLKNGSARLGFWIQNREYLLPVGIVLKALVDSTDREIYANLTCCYNENYKKGLGVVGTHLIGERAKIILDEVRDMSLFTHLQCLQHLGEHFQPIMWEFKNDSYSVVAEAVLKNYIFVHLDSNYDKFNLLIFMLQKLFSLVDQTSVPDNPDALQSQDILVPGHLITIYLKEKLEEWLRKGRFLVQEEIEKQNKNFTISDLKLVKKVMEKNPLSQISSAVENLLKTGNMNTQSGLDMQQRAGYTVQAERLNFLRFLSFFRAVHRGASFAGLRTTSVRKLLPESWGFLCPVHTPDGEPCGLLNHMTATCLGMMPSLPKLVLAGPPAVLSVLLDGRVIGAVHASEAEKIVAHLRRLKVSSSSLIPDDLEVGYVPLSMGGAYPGLYLFTWPSRFIRPVRNISLPPEETQNIELISPFEQVFMEIRCADGGAGGRTDAFPATHEEIHPTGMLSVVANLTPWSDHNQSPRNMYQCQMAKQTMAFASQAIHCRADQKLYHLQTPQRPIVHTSSYVKYNVDEFPTGTNAIVAVLSYTGYDMEDAMILNKSAVERGMFHGQIYQTETIDLAEKTRSGTKMFKRKNEDKTLCSYIDVDGLPNVGQRLLPNDPYCSIYNMATNTAFINKRKGSEQVYVDYVSVDMKSKNHPQKVNIRFRHPRNPIIGDKFSSRHGQKGVCSQLWPDIDMPFSGFTGMRPDLIINPHAFPSRMTIAMLLESMAAKGGSLEGKFIEATPFASSVKKANGETGSESKIDEIGEVLRRQGFNYHGVEVLYSGVYGTELTCEIYMGPVYYQRLRHMVSDKFQVRSTGRVDPVTRQPIKGRKFGGGVRFGEMERDSMLAHGAAYLLHDRLHTCSDHHIADVCSICGSILTTSFVQQQKRVTREIGGLPPGRAPKKVSCHSCGTSKGMETVAMPYVFRYLAAELAAMNIKMTLKLSDSGERKDDTTAK